MDDDELIATFCSIGFLRDASPALMHQLAMLSHHERFATRAVIAHQGEPARWIYLVVEGTVALEICAPGVGCKRLLTIGPGELLGWSAVLGPNRWTATARSLSPVTLIAIEGARLQTLCDADPAFGYEFMTRIALAIASRLNATRLQLMDLYGTQMADATGGKSLDEPLSTE